MGLIRRKASFFGAYGNFLRGCRRQLGSVSWWLFALYAGGLLPFATGYSQEVIEPAPGLPAQVIGVADRLLEEAQVSYVYGGSKLGDGQACLQCNSCLEAKFPRPAARLKECPICIDCSLDCSHFTELVFTKAGAPYPYLATAGMLELSSDTLKRRYRLLDIGSHAEGARPGDLLVYDGHVVILERLHGHSAHGDVLRGDVIHATGGRDIKLPGQGIQRERYAEIGHLRGPLRRILRHVSLALADTTAVGERPATLPVQIIVKPTPPPPREGSVAPPVSSGASHKKPQRGERPRLRPVEKRNPNED